MQFQAHPGIGWQE